MNNIYRTLPPKINIIQKMAKPIRIEFNVKDALRGIDSSTEELLTKFENALADSIDFAFTKSQEYVPVDTGHLKRSGDLKKISDKEYEITYTAPYAADVEFGTAEMIAAHGEHSVTHPVKNWEAKRRRGGYGNQQMPFLRPAVFEGKNKFNELVKKP